MRDCGLVVCVALALVACKGSEPDCVAVAPTTWPEAEQADAVLPLFPQRQAGVVTRRFVSSFEAEADFTGFYVVPNPHRGTTQQELSAVQVASGRLAHRAWMIGRNPVTPGENTNHRGYPTVQLHKRAGPFVGKVRIEFKAWLDVPLRACREQDWFSFMTLSSYADDNWYQVQLLNVDSQGIPHLMHVPSRGMQVHDIFQTSSLKVPKQQWVTFTVLVDYGSANAWKSPIIAAWMNGQLVSAARFNAKINLANVPKTHWPACLNAWDGNDLGDAEALCALDFRPGSLAQAHFGLYAPPLLSSGEAFNDDLEILELGPE